MSYSGGWRPHIESALCLNLTRLFDCGTIKPGYTSHGTLHWSGKHGDKVASLRYHSRFVDISGTLTLDYVHGDESKDVTCTIKLVAQPCNYGGRRWYFICPYSGRRALNLYKWRGIDMFCHREAIRPRPTYGIQRTSGSDRVIEQRWALRRRLGDDFTDLLGEPWKPKRMRWRTFERYRARDAELAGIEAGCLARLMARYGGLTGKQ